MTGRFTPTDAERQTGLCIGDYLSRALDTLAECLALEKSLDRDKATFAAQFEPLVAALVEAQARNAQTEFIAGALADIAEQLEDRNAGICRNCTREQRGAR